MKHRGIISRTILVAGIIFFATIVFVTPQKTHAQASNANAAQGIEISPVLVELNGVAGGTYKVTIKVINVTSSKLFYSVLVNDFTAKNETGTPQTLLDSTLPDAASIGSWVTLPDGFTLESRESKTIDVTLTIPQDAEPGGHYGVIRFSGQAPDVDDTGVGLSASVQSLLLVRVDGAITEQAQILEFFSAADGNRTGVFEGSPVGFVTRIQNQGNIHLKPVGSIEVKDAFGSIVSTIPVNEEKSNVLPDSVRRFDSVVNEGWMFGYYTANLTIGYGTKGQALVSSISFWVIPYRIILIALLVILTLGYILKRVVKSYNKRIIERALTHDTKNKPRKKA
jgi:hypothetical protein